MKKKIIMFILSVFMLISIAACGGGAQDADNNGTPSVPPPAESEAASDASPVEPTPAESEMPALSGGLLIDKDREGNPITLPENIEKVISMGPSNTEILVALGCADKVIAIDDYSSNVPGLTAGIPQFSMMSPDGEQLISLNPDVLFVTGMSKAAGDDPFKVVSDAGICVVYIPATTTIEGIKDDISFVASVMGARAKGDEIISAMEAELESVKKIGETITDKKTVYFEISAAPYMYSFGKGVFLNELIEIIGAENVLAGQENWVSVTDEAIISLNPDFIFTSVNYIDDPVGEIKSRPGWSALTAVQNDNVYYIDTDASNRPSHNIVLAMREMAALIYPDKF